MKRLATMTSVIAFGLCSCAHFGVDRHSPSESIQAVQYVMPYGFWENDVGTDTQQALAKKFHSDPTQKWTVLLQHVGVEFPPGSSAVFVPPTGRLLVRNTPSNLSKIDAILWRVEEGDVRRLESDVEFLKLELQDP